MEIINATNSKTSDLSHPEISVVIPIYNASNFISATLDSLIQQDCNNFEVICVDDGSTDNSLSILKEYSTKINHLHIISRPNTGIVGALNDGLSAAKGEFIARLDADDLCQPNRLSTQLNFLKTHKHIIAVGSSAHLIDEWERPIGSFPALEDNERIVALLLKGESAIHHPSVMMRTNAVMQVGGYREGFCPAEDYDLWLRMSEIGELANTSQALITKRQTLGGLVGSRIDERDAVVTRALADAWQRRSKPGSPPKVKPTFKSHLDIYTQWAWLAMSTGFTPTARHYALKVFLRKPLSLKSLRLLVCAYRNK